MESRKGEANRVRLSLQEQLNVTRVNGAGLIRMAPRGYKSNGRRRDPQNVSGCGSHKGITKGVAYQALRWSTLR